MAYCGIVGDVSLTGGRKARQFNTAAQGKSPVQVNRCGRFQIWRWLWRVPTSSRRWLWRVPSLNVDADADRVVLRALGDNNHVLIFRTTLYLCIYTNLYNIDTIGIELCSILIYKVISNRSVYDSKLAYYFV